MDITTLNWNAPAAPVTNRRSREHMHTTQHNNTMKRPAQQHHRYYHYHYPSSPVSLSSLTSACLLLLISASLVCGQSIVPPSSSSVLYSRSSIDIVSATATFDFAGPLIPPNFVSFSIEPYALYDWTGRTPNPVNPSFISLMKQLNPTVGSAGPVLRIGGNSADMAMYNPLHDKRPSMPYGRPLWYDITDNDLLSLKQVVSAIHGKLVLGVNFRVPNNASLAVKYLEAVERLIGWEWVDAVEIGNEPDVFEWSSLRPVNYSMNEYIEEWLLYAKTLYASLPSLPEPIFQGGAFGSLNWAGQWHRFFSKARNYLKSVSYHYYPLSLCQGGTPTIHRLLSDYASQGAARTLMKTRGLTIAHDYGLPLVVSEGSSVSCGRMPGVSNSFASALWAIDQMFVDASIGIKSWHFHYSGGNTTLTYSPLVKQHRDQDTLTVMPIYYGLRFFALATMNHSTIYRVNVTNTTNTHIKVYAMMTAQGVLQMAAIHKDAGTRHTATVSLSMQLPSAFPGYPVATITRLTAPAANSINGVSLGGLTYDHNIEGEPSGNAQQEWVAADAHGVYHVQMDALSAVLLTLNPDGPYRVPDSKQIEQAALGVGETHRQAATQTIPTSLTLHSEDDGAASLRLPVVPTEAGLLSGVYSSPDSSSIPSLEPFPVPVLDPIDLSESWKSRRGKFALIDAKTHYEQQIQAQIEKTVQHANTHKTTLKRGKTQ